MSELDDYLRAGLASKDDLVEDDPTARIGSAEHIAAILAEQVADANETPADYRDELDDDDDDDESASDLGVEEEMGLEEHTEIDSYETSPRRAEPKKPVVFEPLPPDAGVAIGIPRGCREWLALHPPPPDPPEIQRMKAMVRADREARIAAGEPVKMPAKKW